MIRLTKVVCALAALTMTSGALAENSGWSISEADGQVSVIRGDKSLYGARGTALQVGDVVKTSGAANAVLVRGEDFVVIESGKAVRIKPAQQQGVIGQMVEFVSGLFGPSQDHGALNRPMEAAVVKGLGDGVGNALTGDASTDGSSEGQP